MSRRGAVHRKKHFPKLPNWYSYTSNSAEQSGRVLSEKEKRSSYKERNRSSFDPEKLTNEKGSEGVDQEL